MFAKRSKGLAINRQCTDIYCTINNYLFNIINQFNKFKSA